ncbi:MAG: TIGR02996 domain-containing protein [Planctomycetia bacterium]|nr:TIGR02996 domain-containing protein [Planctomycetia bacterium]
MNDEEAFLRAICDQPDEDTPRLVFADWLDEQGGSVNAAWAELIRVQVALARGAGAERERLAARESELEPAVVAVWPTRSGSRPWLKWANWSRGFPLTVSGPGTIIRTARPTFAGRIPLREFNIKPATDADLIEFVTWSELKLVRKLGVWSGGTGPITERGMLALVRCEYLSNLERLRMQWIALTDVSAEAFLDSPYMAQLVSVKITSGRVRNLSEEIQQRIRERFGEWDIY